MADRAAAEGVSVIGAGHLDRRVTLEKPTATPDGMGGTEAGWETVAEVGAGFRYLRGTEAVMAGRLQGRLTAVVTIKRSPTTAAVTTDWRLSEGTPATIWNVRSVIPSDDRDFLELTCESGVAT